MATRLTEIPKDYPELLQTLKERIRTAQVRAALQVNRELVLLYWQIGRDILARQNRKGWGAKVIDQLATDLGEAFPGTSGFSARNLKYMRAFAKAWPEEPIVQEVLAQIPWYHNLALLEKVKARAQRLWYAQQTSQHGWSRNVLVHQIDSSLYRRQGQALTNFERTLPAPQSELAQEILKDPYTFDFLTLGPDVQERELHRGLVHHLRDFLLELGVGFSFVGSEYALEVGGQDFRLDLLFYHLKLRCFVVIELKTTPFQPEFAGKMNFYLAAVDDLLRHSDDQPSIGIILCKGKNQVVAEYALRDMGKPIGVADHRLTTALPDQLKDQLPTVEELQAGLQSSDEDPDA